jgi:hypothetical protein
MGVGYFDMPNMLRSKKFLQFVFLLLIGLGIVVGVRLVQQRQELREKAAGVISTDGAPKFQLAAWVDLGLNNARRGYWNNLGYAPDNPPTVNQITNAKRVLREKYHTNVLYLIYHKQFDITTAKNVFLAWKNAQVLDTYAPHIIPTLVLQNYQDHGCNFSTSNNELQDFLLWLKTNINSEAIAVYDIYNVQANSSRNFCNQMGVIQNIYSGKKIYRVGLQPGENLVSPFTGASQDTYSAVASGETNTLWQTSCGFWGYSTAKKVLEAWVNERVGKDVVSWNFINVAFDYSKNSPCGAEGYEAGDQPLPANRNYPLVHDTIVLKYPGGGSNATWGGFSVDLKILHVHSNYKDGSANSFYSQIKKNKKYQGYFSIPMNEIDGVFDIYDGLEPTATPSPTNTPTPTNKPTTTPTKKPTDTPPVTSTPTPVPGDATGEGNVDIADYKVWINNYNSSTSRGHSNADFNNDNQVDGKDYVIWLTNYGT